MEVTPRESNEMQEEEDSEHNGAAIREPTPERALRKMQKKVRSLHAKQARGEHSRIVAKDVGDSDFPQPQASQMSEGSYSPALRNYYRNTRCTCMAQEEQSAIPAGVFNVYEDSDDEDAYLGEQRELQKEMQELLAAKDWINQKGWDVASEAQVVSPSSGKTIDLRLDWAMVEQKLKQGYGDLAVSDAGDVDEVKVLSDFSLDKLDPTQRVFADRVLKWGDELVDCLLYTSDAADE